VDDHHLAVAGQMHIALEGVHAQACGVVEGLHRVLGAQLRSAAVRNDADLSQGK
jgi:hypothetical protein